jgi:DNA-binding transcriptional LysR family regulator
MTVNFRTGIDWQDVRVFSALARLGTLSGAARALGVTHATVARRIGRLEAALEVTLFHRRPDGYQLTVAAAPLMDAVQRMEDAAGSLARADPEPPLAGLVRLTATASLIDAFLLPWLAPFLAEHPGIDLDIVADRRALSLARYETDIAIRMGRPEDGGVVARRLVDVAYGIYAAPAEAARVAAGGALRFVGFDEANAGVPEAAWLARTWPDAPLRLRVGAHMSQAAACAAGVGLAILPAYIAAGHAALRTVDLGAPPPPRTLWLLTRADVRSTPRLRATASFLAQLFTQNRAAFETPAPGRT